MDPLAVRVSVLARDRPVLFHEGATRRSCSSVDNFSGDLGQHMVRVGSICPGNHQVRPPDKTSRGIPRAAVAASCSYIIGSDRTDCVRHAGRRPVPRRPTQLF